MTAKRTVPSPIKLFYIGIAFQIIAALIVFLNKCPTNSQYFIIYIFSGIGLALIFSRTANRYSITYKIPGLTLNFAGGIVASIFFIYYNPIAKFKSDDCIQTETTVTVFVHGKKGRQDLVLRNQGKVILDRTMSRFVSDINAYGQAFFTDMHIGDRVRLQIDFSEPYIPTSPDSVYVISDKRYIYFEVYLKNINIIKGNIFYKDAPLKDVLVKIDNWSCVTDTNGSYVIKIPDSMQEKSYTAWFIKKGYKSVSYPAMPQTNKPLDILMEKQ